jgi:hypothetical protein
LTGYEHDPPSIVASVTSSPWIYYYDSEDNVTVAPLNSGPYVPRWQTYPALLKDSINLNALMESSYATNAKGSVDTGKATISNFANAPPGDITAANRTTATIATWSSIVAKKSQEYSGSLFARIFLPIFDTFDEENRNVVGVLSSYFLWSDYFVNVVASSHIGITVVLENTCDGYYTYQIDGNEVVPLGEGDLHDPLYSHYKKEVQFGVDKTIPDGTGGGMPFDVNDCIYRLSVYPSQVRNRLLMF